MFEVGFTEIVLIFGIALLVLGPARLPKLAADLGRWAGRARAMARQLRTQLEQEVQFDPLATNDRRPGNTVHATTPAADTAFAAPAPPAEEAAPAPQAEALFATGVAPEPVLESPTPAATTTAVPDVDTHTPRQDGP
jgi:sec-independent protein translocase protein TatB